MDWTHNVQELLQKIRDKVPMCVLASAGAPGIKCRILPIFPLYRKLEEHRVW